MLVDRYLCVYNPVTDKIDLVEDYDVQEKDIPLTTTTTNWRKVKECYHVLQYLYEEGVDVVKRWGTDVNRLVNVEDIQWSDEETVE
jgi:hypothetical protein